MAELFFIFYENTIINRQFICVHKYLMCFEGTAVELKLPVVGGNKHRTAYEPEMLRE